MTILPEKFYNSENENIINCGGDEKKNSSISSGNVNYNIICHRGFSKTKK